MFPPLRFATSLVAVLAVSSAPAACREAKPMGPEDSVRLAEANVRRALDTCYGIPAGPDSSRGARDSARKAPRLSGRMGNFDGFSFFVPAGANPSITASTVSFNGWPACPHCRFGVSVQPDSGISLDQRIAARVAAQKQIDSANADPASSGMQFDEMFGPPRPFVGRAGRGYAITEGCGDCMSVTVLFGRPPTIATINYGFDDDISLPWRHSCEMATLARSLVFRD